MDPAQAVTVDLGNRAVLQTLNRSPSGRLGNGLYAICLTLAEGQRGLAEVFPTTVDEQRRPRPDRIVEGVRVELVQLDLPLKRGRDVIARAQLAPLLAGNRPRQLDDDSVALAVLAVWDDRPQWCDSLLLRHAPRELGIRNQRSEDLAHHYEELVQDIRSDRAEYGLQLIDGVRAIISNCCHRLALFLVKVLIHASHGKVSFRKSGPYILPQYGVTTGRQFAATLWPWSHWI